MLATLRWDPKTEMIWSKAVFIPHSSRSVNDGSRHFREVFIRLLFVNIGATPNEAPRVPMNGKNALPKVSSRQEIAIRLKLTREALGLRPIQVCRDLGFSANTYSQWESGDRRPNLEDMILFSNRYGVSLDWIYRGEPGALPWDIASTIFGAEKRNSSEGKLAEENTKPFRENSRSVKKKT